MTEFIVIAEFPFVANKSFLGDGSRPITIPARFHEAIKQQAITESARSKIIFRKDSVIEGMIRVGWRAGGRYYQITMSKSQTSGEISAVDMGTRLMVRVLKTPQDWLVLID